MLGISAIQSWDLVLMGPLLRAMSLLVVTCYVTVTGLISLVAGDCSDDNGVIESMFSLRTVGNKFLETLLPNLL